MFRSLAFKWTATLLLTSLIGVVVVGAFAYLTTVSEFDRLLTDQAGVEFVEDAQAYYLENASWEGLDDWMRQNWNESETRGRRDSAPDAEQERAPEFNDRSREYRPPPFALVDMSGTVVVEFPPFDVGDTVDNRVLRGGTSVMVNGVRVGTAVPAASPELDPREQRYVRNTNRALQLGAVGASATAIVVGLLLSRQFLRPLSELTRAINAMHTGELDQRVEIRSNDELGSLAQTFNEMSTNLAKANQLRRQMTADIAHDLRTPLTVISGYLEALEDGTLKPTPARFQVMKEEVGLLQRLVEDLRTLSLADSGELKLTCDYSTPLDVLCRVEASFSEAASTNDVALVLDVSPELPEIWVDEERIIQALGNLVTNALRHTPTGGQITLLAYETDDMVTLAVRDTGVGIAPEDLPNIFERFYRSDPSRQSESGESGLGLAIVRSIVEAHDGTVEAQSTLGEGTTMLLHLKRKKA